MDITYIHVYLYMTYRFVPTYFGIAYCDPRLPNEYSLWNLRTRRDCSTSCTSRISRILLHMYMYVCIDDPGISVEAYQGLQVLQDRFNSDQRLILNLVAYPSIPPPHHTDDWVLRKAGKFLFGSTSFFNVSFEFQTLPSFRR